MAQLLLSFAQEAVDKTGVKKAALARFLKFLSFVCLCVNVFGRLVEFTPELSLFLAFFVLDALKVVFGD